MPGDAYTYTGGVDCTIPADKAQCKGKSIIVTGGAQGIGEAIRSFICLWQVDSSFVTFCDINEKQGHKLEAELSPDKVCFVQADTRSWEDQMRVFQAAISRSPCKSVDVVIANAGVGRGSGDPMMALEDPETIPTKPSMHIIDINLIGVMYSLKLAIHYFRASPATAERDRCFIFGGSIAGYVDNLSSWEYSTSKFGLRGLMRAVRRQSYHQGIRVAYIAPSYVQTAIQSREVYQSILDKGLEFASLESCTNAAMKITCDRTINGRSLGIVPYSVAKEGFIDLDQDDFLVGEETFLAKFQNNVFNLRGDDWQ